MKRRKWIAIGSLQVFAEGGAVGADSPGEAAALPESGQQTPERENTLPENEKALPEGEPQIPEEEMTSPEKEMTSPEKETDPQALDALLHAVQGAEGLYGEWMRQAEEAMAFYPWLDLRREARNPAFLYLLDGGLDVGSAYLALHKEEVLPALMQQTARIVEQRLAGKLRTEGLRPGENGLRGQGTAVTKPDVAKLSRAQREEIRRRVARGERIRL